MEKKHFNDNDLKPRKWLLYILIVINIVIIIVLANKVITDKKDSEYKGNNFFENFFDNANDVLDSSNNEFDKRSFNSKFEMYVGTEWGTSVSNLIDKIITNNKTNEKHIITVVFDNITSTNSDEIRSIKKSLDKWEEYEVILDYDESGYVYLITIEK